MNLVIFFLSLVTFTLVTSNQDIDLCIKNKLNFPERVNHQTILRDIEEGNYKRFRYAARSALQICHPTFDIVAGQIFKQMTKPKVPLNDIEFKCFQRYILNRNPEGLLVPQLDNSLAGNFIGSDNCDEIVKKYIQLQISNKMPEGTEGELNCMQKFIDEYMSGRVKALIMSKGDYSYEIFIDEKNRFARELRDVSEKLIKCIVAL